MKYMGSKARLAKSILPIILKSRKPGQWYVEPFSGGMNTICEVKGNRIANDIHYHLIEMWKELLRGWVPKEITKKEYMEIKTNQDKYPPYLVGWAGFNCSYCGTWFGGFAGSVRTKIGTIRNYQEEAIRNILKQTKKMIGVRFFNESFHDLRIPPNSIIYCDPPYKGTSKYVNDIDHDLFWDWVRDADEQGHTVFVSEYSAPNDFECVWQKNIKSSLSANGRSGGSKKSVEKLFKHKGHGSV